MRLPPSACFHAELIGSSRASHTCSQRRVPSSATRTIDTIDIDGRAFVERTGDRDRMPLFNLAATEKQIGVAGSTIVEMTTAD